MLFAFTEYALNPQHLHRVALCLLVALFYALVWKHSKVCFLRAVGSPYFLGKMDTVDFKPMLDKVRAELAASQT